MNVNDLRSRYDYGRWANDRLMSVIERLRPEEFTRDIAGGKGSIRNTLVHILSAESGWLARCGGPERGPRLNAQDFPTLASVKDARKQVDQHVIDFLASLSEEDVERTITYSSDDHDNLNMRLGEMMEHAANHGVHHRGQVSLMLRMLGQAPEDIDLLMHYADKRGVIAW
ncbi:MAG TPA: DinB family protein [Blastocatellia bacterium]|nr:DinB family protein [Blastocatellia bacterium]